MYLCLIIFNPIPNIAQLSPKNIDSLMEVALEKFMVAGASIAIVKDGEIIHQKGYGITSIETSEPVNEYTNFQIASNTKAFTTTALSILVDEGKLKWTDKVKDHISEFKMYDDYVTENFNIHDLITHRSGLDAGVGNLMFFPDGSDFTIDDVVTCFQYFKPVSAFRTKFGYDDILYVVAGEIIARTSGMSYDAFVQNRIIDPLQMKRTSVGSLHKDESNMAKPHSSDSGALETLTPFKISIGSPAGGIYSNVVDMSKWMLLWLNKGKYGNDMESQLFSNNNYNEMWRLHTVFENNPSPRYNTHFSGYGLGWVLSDEMGHLKVMHNGGVPGMMSSITMYPDINLGIVVLTNTHNGGIGLVTAVTNSIADSYLGLGDIGWVNILAGILSQGSAMFNETTQNVWLKVESVKDIKINNKNFVGVFEDNWFGKVEVFEKNNELWIKSYRSPQLIGQMFFYSDNTFAIKWKYRAMNCDAFATFLFDNEGIAQSIQMMSILPNADFDFQDLDLKRVNN